MDSLLPTRWSALPGRERSLFASAGGFLGVFVMIAASAGVSAQQHAPVFHAPKQPAPAPRQQNNFQGPQNSPPRNQNQGQAGGVKNNPHLTEWMNRHREMPVEQQQRALESEPGFRELPAQTQQRMREQLSQLNNMRPEVRNRMLEHNEAMEHLTGQQRQQVRGAMLQLGSLPEDRRRVVARTFRDLRAMPEGQRQQYMNSPEYRSQFSDQERNTMSNLMSVEPYIPGHKAGDPPQQ